MDVDNQGNGTFERYCKELFYWYKNVMLSNSLKLE